MNESNGSGDNPTIVPVTGGAPAWIQAMRDAAQKLITPADVEAIVKNQVEAAKQGDRNAIRFVFEQVLGGQQVKAGTIIQNNYHGAPPEASPRAAAPTTNRGLDGPIPPEWKCGDCGHRVHSTTPPQMCEACGKQRFTRVLRRSA